MGFKIIDFQIQMENVSGNISKVKKDIEDAIAVFRENIKILDNDKIYFDINHNGEIVVHFRYDYYIKNLSEIIGFLDYLDHEEYLVKVENRPYSVCFSNGNYMNQQLFLTIKDSRVLDLLKLILEEYK